MRTLSPSCLECRGIAGELGGGRESMDSAPDLLHLFVQALALVATSLDHWFHIPWLLTVAVLFVPVLDSPALPHCQGRNTRTATARDT
jgi:hypothetical protein